MLKLLLLPFRLFFGLAHGIIGLVLGILSLVFGLVRGIIWLVLIGAVVSFFSGRHHRCWRCGGRVW